MNRQRRSDGNDVYFDVAVILSKWRKHQRIKLSHHYFRGCCEINHKSLSEKCLIWNVTFIQIHYNIATNVTYSRQCSNILSFGTGTDQELSINTNTTCCMFEKSWWNPYKYTKDPKISLKLWLGNTVLDRPLNISLIVVYIIFWVSGWLLSAFIFNTFHLWFFLQLLSNHLSDAIQLWNDIRCRSQKLCNFFIYITLEISLSTKQDRVQPWWLGS